MKSYLKLCLLAALIGVILAFLFYKSIDNDVNAKEVSLNKVYVFQSGVFNIKDNAYLFANNYKSKIVYYDKEYYRVFIGISINNKDRLINYFNSLNIKYFLKEYNNIPITDELNNYDLALGKVSNNSIDEVNQKMLDIFLTYLQSLS